MQAFILHHRKELLNFFNNFKSFADNLHSFMTGFLVRKETQGRSHEDGDCDVKIINPKDGQ